MAKLGDIVEKIRECICCIATYQLPIVCYLCKEEIKADLWNSGDHRWGQWSWYWQWYAAVGEDVPADRQCSCPCCSLTLLWTVITATRDSDCGQTRYQWFMRFMWHWCILWISGDAIHLWPVPVSECGGVVCGQVGDNMITTWWHMTHTGTIASTVTTRCVPTVPEILRLSSRVHGRNLKM